MLMIRFQRIGRKNDPAFRIVLLEKERAAKAGNVVELLGTYNPKTKAMTLQAERVKQWLAHGAHLTDSVHNLLINKGVLSGKKVNIIPPKKFSAGKALAAAVEEKAVEETAAAAPAEL